MVASYHRPRFLLGSTYGSGMHGPYLGTTTPRSPRVHATPWKVAVVYGLLSVAESRGVTSGSLPPQRRDEPPPRRPGDTRKVLLTAQDVAGMTGLGTHAELVALARV